MNVQSPTSTPLPLTEKTEKKPIKKIDKRIWIGIAISATAIVVIAVIIAIVIIFAWKRKTGSTSSAEVLQGGQDTLLPIYLDTKARKMVFSSTSGQKPLIHVYANWKNKRLPLYFYTDSENNMRWGTSQTPPIGYYHPTLVGYISGFQEEGLKPLYEISSSVSFGSRILSHEMRERVSNDIFSSEGLLGYSP